MPAYCLLAYLAFSLGYPWVAGLALAAGLIRAVEFGYRLAEK